jgi:hypothetical protein
MGDGGRHGRLKNITFPARFHLFLPAFLDLAATHSPVDEPAQITQFEFPCRAVLLVLIGAVLRRPTFRPSPSLSGVNSPENKQELPLNMGGHSSPPLLEALYGFEGRAKKLGRLELRLPQKSSNFRKLDSIHPGASSERKVLGSKQQSSLSSTITIRESQEKWPNRCPNSRPWQGYYFVVFFFYHSNNLLSLAPGFQNFPILFFQGLFFIPGSAYCRTKEYPTK